MVRVLLDASAIPAQHGGVGRYVTELAHRLADTGTDLHVAVQARDADLFTARLGPRRVHPLPRWAARRPARLLWEQVGLPRLVRKVGAEVLHSPHYTLPLRSPVPVVVTVHDATFFTAPQLHQAVKARFFRIWTRIAVRRADAVVVPSRATATELNRLLGRLPAPAEVIPHGVDHDRFRPPTPAQVSALREELGLSGDYVCFLGTLEPRKNVPALVRAWAQACAGREHPPALVLAGAPGWDEELEPALAAVPGRLRVVRTGFLADDRLPALLGDAAVVCYPSLGEGFGLPVLEAMACGACVLTTADLSLPEVGADAVAYPTSPGVEDLARALTGLLDDPGRRRGLAERALARAAGFGWDRSAAQHLETYARVSAAGHAGAARPTSN
jgi:glycosyltransferase involved in cell wall biosynthesis